MSSIQTFVPNLMVSDVRKSVVYYQNILGFDLTFAVSTEGKRTVTDLSKDDSTLIYAQMKCGDAEVMFQEKESFTEDIPGVQTKIIGGSVSFYCLVEGIEELFKKIKNQVTVTKKPETSWYGMREFFILDCNGYSLGFAEKDENFNASSLKNEES